LVIISEEKERLLNDLKELRTQNEKLLLDLRLAKTHQSNDHVSQKVQVQVALSKKNDLMQELEMLKSELEHVKGENEVFHIKNEELLSQNSLLLQKILDPSVVELLKSAHQELNHTVSKLVEAEASSEVSQNCANRNTVSEIEFKLNLNQFFHYLTLGLLHLLTVYVHLHKSNHIDTVRAHIL